MDWAIAEPRPNTDSSIDRAAWIPTVCSLAKIRSSPNRVPEPVARIGKLDEVRGMLTPWMRSLITCIKGSAAAVRRKQGQRQSTFADAEGLLPLREAASAPDAAMEAWRPRGQRSGGSFAEIGRAHV